MKNVTCGTLSMCVLVEQNTLFVLVNISQMGEIRFRFDSQNQMISPSVHDWRNKCHNIITTLLPLQLLTHFDWSLCSCGLQSYDEKMWGPAVLFCCWGFKSAINRFKSSLKSEFWPEGKACCRIHHFMHTKLFAAPLFRNGSLFLWFSSKTYITPQHTNYKPWQNQEVPCLHIESILTLCDKFTDSFFWSQTLYEPFNKIHSAVTSNYDVFNLQINFQKWLDPLKFTCGSSATGISFFFQ